MIIEVVWTIAVRKLRPIWALPSYGHSVVLSSYLDHPHSADTL